MPTEAENPDHSCFHCGLPITTVPAPELRGQGKNRRFCCHGCQAVCTAIIESGNEKYYEYRDRPAATAAGVAADTRLADLSLFDRPEIQQDFVRHGQSGEQAWLILENIHCAACLWLNERHIRQLDGVLDCQMDYTSQQARVSWDADKIKLSDILAAIARIGYIAHPFDPARREALQKEQQQRSVQRLIFALILGMTIMNFSLASYVFGAPDSAGEYPLWIRIARWTNLFASGVLLAYSGQLFFRNAREDLRHRRVGMDMPVALGLSLAWLGSLKSTVTGSGDVYFESIAMFVVFLLLARYVELKARVEATALLDQTARIIPATARRISGGVVETVLVTELEQGDSIRVKPGEIAPADSLLTGPEASFDESLLSGEAQPVLKRTGEFVAGGSVVIDQTVTLQVEKTSAHSTLVEIQQLARGSLKDKPAYVQLADRMAGKFIAIILSLAALTLIFWLAIRPDQALSNTIAVLIVTCPCALALAAPVALTLCSAGLIRLGVIPVHMSAIESVAKANVLILDKTGTLTTGNPVLQSTLVTGAGNSERLIAVASALEADSAHPYARAFRAACPAPDIDTTRRRNFPGRGVEGVIDGKLWKLGNAAFVAGAESWLRQEENGKLISQRQQSGDSVLYLGDERALYAVFLLRDPLRQGAREFIASTEKRGIKRILVLSGDHPDSTRALARAAGINEAHGGFTPDKKLAFVQQLQSRGDTVMMIGDGINDAPVLAAADISLTISDATDLARSHSDLIILGHDFYGLRRALPVMAKTRRIIIENLAWAAAYNLTAIPAAAAGLITPWMAAAGMTSSSLIVVLNSMRLKGAARASNGSGKA